MAEPTSCCVEPGGYCARVDTLFNLLAVHALDVAWLGGRGRLPAGLRLIVETGATEQSNKLLSWPSFQLFGERSTGIIIRFHRRIEAPPG
jgi:hypothetical protein